VSHDAIDGIGSFPDTIDPAGQYVFYLHGRYVEVNGPDADYRYLPILRAIRDKGFTVIGEVRGETDVDAYADDIAAQVRALKAAGVPASNITVAGHSKGGFIALVASTKIADPDISYVLFAACGLPGHPFGALYVRFLEDEAEKAKGRFLVAWAADDDVAGCCDVAFNIAGVPFENKVLPSGKGHQLFFDVEPVWLDLLAAVAGGR